MPQATNYITPFDAASEERLITFDFGVNLNAGVTLIGTPTVTCTLTSGTDPNPLSRLLSAAGIVDAPGPPFGSGVASGAVSILVGTMIAGAAYVLQCVAQTSDGQDLSLWQDVTCVQPS